MLKFYKNLFSEYQKTFLGYSKNSFFENVYRLCAIIISPLAINLNPNFISLLSLLLGLMAFALSFFYEEISINIIIIFFLFSFILDFLDGLIARYQKKTSFYGRFIDGLFDIIVGGLLHIILFTYISKFNSNFFHTYFYLIIILFYPIQHLILDRYSALARWINETNKKKLKPYYRNIFLGKLTKLLFDFQHLCIWLLLLNKMNYNYVIEAFFILSLCSSILTFGIYLFLSNKYFSSTGNQSDNND